MVNTVRDSRKIKAERSNLLLTACLDSVIMESKKCIFCIEELTVGRLERVQNIIFNKEVIETIFDKTFNNFRKEGEMRNRYLIR